MSEHGVFVFLYMIVPTLCVGMQPRTFHVPKSLTQSVTGGVTTQSVGTIIMGFFVFLYMIVPTLCVGMQPRTLRVPKSVTQSVTGGVPTQNVGTISGSKLFYSGAG
jgi:hypothetical protein